MPFRRRFPATRRRFRRRPRYGLATRPRMMGRSQFKRRQYGTDTKVFWFKENGITHTPSAAPGVTGFYQPWRTFDLSQVGSPSAFQTLARLYDQYKLLAMKVRIFPANPSVDDFLPLRRGNIVVWTDQRYDSTVPVPTLISEVIGNNNARITNPLRRYAVAIYRPKGKPIWGSTKQMATLGDPWSGEINLLCNDCTVTPVGTPPSQLYYWTRQYKVIFRARVDD